MDSQNRSYRLQDNGSEMQQNLRAAIDTISKDLMLTGLGPKWPMTGRDAAGNAVTTGGVGGWYLDDGSNPYRILADQVDIIGCMSGISVGLNAQANQGDTQLTLASAADAASFPVNSYINIGGVECARVTAVAGSTLTVDTNPVTTGTQNLTNAYPAQTLIRPLQWITYARTGTTLTRDSHDGSGPRTIANDITGLAANANGRMLTVTLTGSTPAPNPITSSATNTVFRRADKNG
jgi:hypothetical protein